MTVSLGAIVLDCSDPRVLARFYADVLGWRVAEGDDGWMNVRSPDGGGTKIGCQRVDGYEPPTWPAGPRPQMLHVDFAVSSIDDEHERVVALGAVPQGSRQHDESGEFQVYLDPAGHPFCLCDYSARSAP